MDHNKNYEEIKKLRKDFRSLTQSVELVRQSIDGVHQTVTAGLQKVLSEIENLKIENVKIKSNLKYMIRAKNVSSADSTFMSDTEVRTGNWLSSRNSMPFASGSQFNHSKVGFRGPQQNTIKSPDLSSSDDTDDDRVTLVTDSVEEDTVPRQRKEKRRTNHQPPLSLRSEKQTILTSDLSSSSSDGKKYKETSLSQNNLLVSRLKDKQTVDMSNITAPPVGQDVIETDQNYGPTLNGADGFSSERLEVTQNGFMIDPGEESEEDTNIAMEVETKLHVSYPHTVPNYQPIMVPYDQIKFGDGAEYLKSLGFVIMDPNVKEFIYKIGALDFKKNEQLPKGLYTLLLLDTSYSTGPGGLLEMRKFVNDFLDEIETATEYNLEEMVGVMEFGSHSGVLHEFTNDYSLIRECLDKIDVCSGRTNLWSAMIGLLAYCHKKAKKCVINGRTHGVRIVMVSDGNMTDEISILSNCENEADLERIEDRIFKFMPYLLREKMTLSGVEIGMDSEARFLKKFVEKGKGQYGLALWANYVGRYYLYQTIIGKMLPELKDPKNRGKIKDLIMKHTAEYSHFNKTDIAEISLLLTKRYKFEVPEELFEREPLPEYDDDFRVELYTKETFPRLLPIGTRVEKGSKFKDRHRDYNKGTVVSHCKRNTLVVKWDEEPTKIHFYKYETENHEVELILDFRKIDMTVPGLIETGCRVIRGVDWNRGDEDGGRGQMGVVIKKHAKKWVTVKWPNGKRERYRFGAEDCYDLEIVDEGERQKRNIKETVQQYQFRDNTPTEWRTLDEDSNNSVINHVDSLKGGTWNVMHHGIEYKLNLHTMTYEICRNESVKGEIRILGVTLEEQKELREKEWNLYLEKKRSAQLAQAGGAGGMNLLAQMQQAGGRGMMDQSGGGLAGLLGQNAGGLTGLMGQNGAGLAGLMGQNGGGLAGLMGQNGAGLAGLMGQNGGGGSGMGGGFSQQGFGTKWNCSKCTLENPPHAGVCEACGASRT